MPQTLLCSTHIRVKDFNAIDIFSLSLWSINYPITQRNLSVELLIHFVALSHQIYSIVSLTGHVTWHSTMMQHLLTNEHRDSYKQYYSWTEHTIIYMKLICSSSYSLGRRRLYFDISIELLIRDGNELNNKTKPKRHDPHRHQPPLHIQCKVAQLLTIICDLCKANNKIKSNYQSQNFNGFPLTVCVRS